MRWKFLINIFVGIILSHSLLALPMGEIFHPDNQVHWSSLPEILVRKLNGDAERIRQYICSPHQARREEYSSRIFFLLLFKQAYYNRKKRRFDTNEEKSVCFIGPCRLDWRGGGC